MDNSDQELTKLQQQLNEALAASEFFETEPGRLWAALATAKITKITRDITSDKYRKDLTGYNIALSDLQAYKHMLKEMQVAGSEIRIKKIKEKLDEESI